MSRETAPVLARGTSQPETPKGMTMPSAERAIENLIARYAFLVDDGDFAGLGELLEHADFRLGEACAHGKSDIEELARAVLQTYPDGTPRTPARDHEPDHRVRGGRRDRHVSLLLHRLPAGRRLPAPAGRLRPLPRPVRAPRRRLAVHVPRGEHRSRRRRQPPRQGSFHLISTADGQ